ARCQQIVADNASVAAPPHRFRAHDGAGSFPAGGNQLLKRLSEFPAQRIVGVVVDRKSTRLNSSHVSISYAVFCLKKIKKSKSQTVWRPLDMKATWSSTILVCSIKCQKQFYKSA